MLLGRSRVTTTSRIIRPISVPCSSHHMILLVVFEMPSGLYVVCSARSWFVAENKCLKFGILMSEMNDRVLEPVQILLQRWDLTRHMSFLAQKPSLICARNVREPIRWIHDDTIFSSISIWLMRRPVLRRAERGLSAGPPLEFALIFLISQTNPHRVIA